MKKSTRIRKWGNGADFLLLKVIRNVFSIKTDDFVEISSDKQDIIIPLVKKKHLTLVERFEGYKGYTKQEEY